MSDEPHSFAKAAPIKLRRQRKLTNPSAKSLANIDNIVLKHLNIGVNWFDDNAGPEPWVWASALSLHLFLMAIFISIPPMEFKPRPVFGVEIINENAPKELEPPEIEPLKNEQQQTEIEPQTKPIFDKKTIVKEEPKAIEDLPIEPDIAPDAAPIVPENIAPPTVRIPPPEVVKSNVEILPKVLEKRELNTKKLIQTPKIAPIESIKPEEIEEPIDEIMTPEKVVVEPVNRPNFQDSKRLETKSDFKAEPRKLGAGNLKQNKNSAIPAINPNLQIDVEALRREAEAKEAREAAAVAAQNAREQAIRDAAKQAASKPTNNANTAPIAKNGELAPPSGAGVTAIGQNPIVASGGSGGVAATNGGAQSANPSGGGGGAAGGANGPLPRGPRIVGNGRNVFENSENGSLLARMARTADCSSINRERDEKCPNWEPLEKAPKAIPAPIPKNATRPKTGIDPLPACPPGTPQSNMGRTCLPSKSAPNGITQ